MFCSKMTLLVGAVVLVMTMAMLGDTRAAMVQTPLNGSFESPVIISGDLLLGVVPTSWSVSPNAVDQIIHRPQTGSERYAIPTAGSQLYGLECNTNGDARTGIQQDLGSLTAGETYTFNATLFSNFDGKRCGYTISFYDVTDSKTLASITEADYDPSALGTLKTLAATFSYEATAAEAGDTLRLIMESKSGSELNWPRTGVDAVTVVTSVPEPVTAGLLALGSAFLVARRRRTA